MLDSECYRCSDFFEDEAVCYVCYQQLTKKIEKLEAEIAKLKERALQ